MITARGGVALELVPPVSIRLIADPGEVVCCRARGRHNPLKILPYGSIMAGYRPMSLVRLNQPARGYGCKS